MENTATGGAMPTAYDYHMYDQVWQRVSPTLDPYPETRAAPINRNGAGQTAPPMSSLSSSSPSTPSTPSTRAETPVPPNVGESTLPGAEEDPCCMGTEAQSDLEVVGGFIEEELAERRYCLALAQKSCRPDVARLMRRIAGEKREAARELAAAYFLITGACYTPAITIDPMRWDNLCQALRSCYHQEACNGLNYQRAADATGDLCLQKLLNRLGENAYQRAGEILDLLGKLVT